MTMHQDGPSLAKRLQQLKAEIEATHGLQIVREARPNKLQIKSLVQYIMTANPDISKSIHDWEPTDVFPDQPPNEFSASNARKPIQCKNCHGLRTLYGKTRVSSLKQTSSSGCEGCRLIIDILHLYAPDVEPESRVRLFAAPIADNSTLTIWCQGDRSDTGDIPFIIEVFVRPDAGEPSPFHTIGEATDISGDTSSDRARCKAEDWLSQCKDQHSNCPSNDCVPLPTRLVHISAKGPRYTVKLVETDGQVGRYACLSHRWGAPGSVVVTVNDTYDLHRTNIPFDSLSRIFKDTIATAWSLGIHYVWVDSLCIIQDSEDDWRKQASRMAAYYQLADITLAASAVNGPEDGLFRLSDPEYLAQPLSWSNNTGMKYNILVRRTISHGTFNWPLLKRGWVYQERMLSPRVLHFGEQELVWECANEAYCECSQCRNFASGLSGKVAHHSLLAKPRVREEWCDHWRKIVQEYCKLGLSLYKDKLPALAGLARLVKDARQHRYLAGLWEESLVGDMLWSVHYTQKVLGDSLYRNRPEAKVAPTWSWAAIEKPDLLVYACSIHVSYGEHGHITHTHAQTAREKYVKCYCATVVDARCELIGEDECGEVSSGHVVLRAPYIPALVQQGTRNANLSLQLVHGYKRDEIRPRLKVSDYEAKSIFEGGILPTKVLEFYPDYGLFLPGPSQLANSTWVKLIQMALVDRSWLKEPDICICLVLRPVGQDSEYTLYERIGLATYDTSKDAKKWHENAQTDLFKII